MEENYSAYEKEMALQGKYKLMTSDMMNRDIKLAQHIDSVLYVTLGFSPAWEYVTSYDKSRLLVRIREDVRGVDITAVFNWVSIEERTIEDEFYFTHDDGQVISYKEVLEKFKEVNK